MSTIKATIKQLEERTGLSQTSLSVILKEAEKTGQARIVDSIQSPTGKGRASNVWEVNKTVTFNFGD